MRKAIGKRLRFEIFDRDQFTCQYCGKAPPEVMLHVDHVIPVSGGGTNDPENLRTSCVSCNLGKSDRLIGVNVGAPDYFRRAQEAMEASESASIFKAAKLARSKYREDISAFVCDALSVKGKRVNRCQESTVSSLMLAIENHGGENVINWFEAAVRKTSKSVADIKAVYVPDPNGITCSLVKPDVYPMKSVNDETSAMKYFHGILRRIRERGEQ